MRESKYGKYIVTELKTPEFSAEAVALYDKFARRILWLDDNVVEGSFQVNASWYLHPATPLPQQHVHDADEVVAFFGSDPDDPHTLNGEVEFWLEDEQHIIAKSCFIFIPGGMKHCPLIIRRVDKPIFHFSTVTAGKYVRTITKGID